MKNIYLIVGRSGSGKSTIVQTLCQMYNYKEVQSYTERPRRFEDEQGHIFITPTEFDQLQDLCAFTVFKGNRYGVPASMVEECDLYVIDPAGIEYMKEHYHGTKNIIVIGICSTDIVAEEEIICYNRMLERGDTAEEAQARLVNDRNAFMNLDQLTDYTVANTNVLKAVNDIKTIIDELERR